MTSHTARMESAAAKAALDDAGDGDSLGRALNLMRLFWSLDHRMQVASKSLESRIGLTEPQRLVVALVARNPGISVGEVARQQHWHSATVTGIAQRLEKRGLLARRSDASDRRRKSLYLTARGKRLVQSNDGTTERAVEKALNTLPAETVAAASHVLTAVSRELQIMLSEA